MYAPVQNVKTVVSYIIYIYIYIAVYNHPVILHKILVMSGKPQLAVFIQLRKGELVV